MSYVSSRYNRFPLGRPVRAVRRVPAGGRRRLRSAVRRVRRVHALPYANRAASKPEIKTFDVGQTTPVNLYADSSTAVANSAGGYLLATAAIASAIVINQIPQGSSPVTRIGRKCRMTAVHIRGMIAIGQAGADTAKAALCLVYIPRLNTGTTTMPPQNLLHGAQNPNTQRVIQYSSRFIILRRWDFNLMGDRNACTTGREQEVFDEVIKLGSKELAFTSADSTGVFDDMTEGALCLYAMSNTAAAADTSCLLTLSTRVYFYDS